MSVTKHESKREHKPGLRESFRLLRLLLARGLRGHLAQTLSLIGLQLAGVISGIAAFLVLISYIQQRLGGSTSRLTALLPAPGPDTTGLLLSALGALFLGLASAWSLHSARRGILGLTRRFHYRCILEALRALERADLQEQASRVEFIAGSHDPRHLAPVYARYVASAFRILLESLHPATVCLAVFGFLVYLDPIVAALLAPLGLAVAGPLRRLGREAAAAQTRMMAEASELSPRLMRLGGEIAQGAVASAERTSVEQLDDQSLQTMLDDYYRPLLLLQRTSTAGQVVQTVCLVWLFAVVGLGISRSGGSWSGLLALLIALRFLASSLRTLSVSMINFARYRPALETYWHFVSPDPSTTSARPGEP